MGAAWLSMPVGEKWTLLFPFFRAGDTDRGANFDLTNSPGAEGPETSDGPIKAARLPIQVIAIESEIWRVLV